MCGTRQVALKSAGSICTFAFLCPPTSWEQTPKEPSCLPLPHDEDLALIRCKDSLMETAFSF